MNYIKNALKYVIKYFSVNIIAYYIATKKKQDIVIGANVKKKSKNNLLVGIIIKENVEKNINIFANKQLNLKL